MCILSLFNIVTLLSYIYTHRSGTVSRCRYIYIYVYIILVQYCYTTVLYIYILIGVGRPHDVDIYIYVILVLYCHTTVLYMCIYIYIFSQEWDGLIRICFSRKNRTMGASFRYSLPSYIFFSMLCTFCIIRFLAAFSVVRGC